MLNRTNKKGFSLTEVLIAIGVLSIGMLFVAGTFPVGIYFSTLASERTLAAEIADEAFAMIRLYAGEKGVATDKLYFNRFSDFNDVTVFLATDNIQADEFLYPSVEQSGWNREYSWSAICRRTARIEGIDSALTATDVNDPNFVDPNSLIVPAKFGPAVQVAVFVCRKTGAGGRRYYMPDKNNDSKVDLSKRSDVPLPILVEVTNSGVEENELVVKDSSEKVFFNDGSVILDDESGRIYRVLERYRDYGAEEDDTLLLDRRWAGPLPEREHQSGDLQGPGHPGQQRDHRRRGLLTPWRRPARPDAGGTSSRCMIEQAPPAVCECRLCV